MLDYDADIGCGENPNGINATHANNNSSSSTSDDRTENNLIQLSLLLLLIYILLANSAISIDGLFYL